MLDPLLPEKQRARRRLIGAVALVLAAIVLLPMVLDSHPKPVADDVAINIPNNESESRASRLAENQPASNAPAVAATGADVAPDDQPPAPGNATPLAATRAPDSATAGIAAPAPLPVSPATQATGKPNAGSARPNAGASPNATSGNISNGGIAGNSTTAAKTPNSSAKVATPRTPATAATTPLGNGSATGAVTAAPAPATTAGLGNDAMTSAVGSRFVVQMGAFSSEARARIWANKLKASGVPAYLEHKKQPDGSQLTLLRAGPFADRAAAQNAVDKVREAGLSAAPPTSTGSGAPTQTPAKPARAAP